MTIGELKSAVAALDDDLEIEIIVRDEYGAGRTIERSYDIERIAAKLDPDTAREYARVECCEPA